MLACATALWIPLVTLAVAAGAAPPLFEDIGDAAGLRFEYRSGAEGELYLPEIMGGGAALLDYDADGDLDVYLVQGAPRSPLRPGSGEEPAQGDVLLRNELREPGALPRFVDASEALPREGAFGMGVATGDYDNDGWIDLYVANLGPDALLHNESGRTFRDVTAQAGVRDQGWSVAATFVDFDRDGWLDLFVADYLVWSRERSLPCYAQNTRRDYCGPAAFPPATSRLLRNRRDGTFEPFATDTFAARPGPALGVVALDVDDDRYLDLLVANDGKPNHLWRNLGGRGFREDAQPAGIAVNRYGLSEAGMGIAVGDIDDDGDEDVLISHLTGESNTLYARTEPGFFEDATPRSGLGPPSIPATGFGAAFLDLEGDADLDLVVVHGAVRLEHGRAGPLDAGHAAKSGSVAGVPATAELGQPNQAFLNVGGGRFVEATERMPPSYRLAETSRGLALGDVDNDRVLDFLVVQVDAPARLYRGARGGTAIPLGLRVVDRNGRDASGARVSWNSGGSARSRTVRTDGSYASASDPRLVLPRQTTGLQIEALRVDWPDGTTDSWTGPELAELLEAARRGYATIRPKGSP